MFYCTYFSMGVLANLCELSNPYCILYYILVHAINIMQLHYIPYKLLCLTFILIEDHSCSLFSIIIFAVDNNLIVLSLLAKFCIPMLKQRPLLPICWKHHCSRQSLRPNHCYHLKIIISTQKPITIYTESHIINIWI